MDVAEGGWWLALRGASQSQPSPTGQSPGPSLVCHAEVVAGTAPEGNAGARGFTERDFHFSVTGSPQSGGRLQPAMNTNTWLMDPRSWAAGSPGMPSGTALATLPADLRQWVNDATLVGWVLEVVADALEGCSPTSSLAEDGPLVPTMLTVLTYCYATARCASDEIETVTATDPTVRYLCASQFVTSSAIRRFRRAHRALLHSCLTAIHRRAWQHRFEFPDTGREWSTRSARFERLHDDRFTYRLAAAAEQKIQQAILADTMALDV